MGLIKIENVSKYNKTMKVLPIFILIAIFSLGIGYAALSAITFNITGSLGLLGANRGIFISSVVDELDNEIDGSYSDTILNSNVSLSPNDLNSTKTYEITITNNTSLKYEFDKIVCDETAPIYSNADIEYTISGLSQGDIINSHGQKTFEITFQYKEGLTQITDNSLNSTIQFLFEKAVTNFDLNGIIPNQPFKRGPTEFNASSQTFYVEMDISGVNRNVENLISIGEDISEWDASSQLGANEGVDLHIYYPDSNGKVVIATIILNQYNGWKQWTKDFSNMYKTMKIAFNSNGLFMNGVKVFDSSELGSGTKFLPGSGNKKTTSEFLTEYFEYWQPTDSINVEIGSEQGTSKSNATYKAIQIYEGAMSAEELIELTATNIEDLKTIEGIDSTEFLVGPDFAAPYTATNNLFEIPIPAGEEIYNLSQKTVYVNMDVSALTTTNKKENIISIGHAIQNWNGTPGVNVHFYYPEGSNHDYLILSLVTGTPKQWRVPISSLNVVNGQLKIALGVNGLYINGVKIVTKAGINTEIGMQHVNGTEDLPEYLDNVFNSKLAITNNNTPMKIGSKEGSARSTATYNEIKIYQGALLETQLQELTTPTQQEEQE